jgi:predicted NACHT family NTPase
MHTAMARFTYVKTLGTFDFSFQPSIDKKKIHELASGRVIEHAENVIFLGPPGTGKTHLAVAFARNAVQRGTRPISPALPAYSWRSRKPADCTSHNGHSCAECRLTLNLRISVV